MIDDRPYIIVDNRKIAPIAPSTGARRQAGERKKAQDQPFGVVDRVTISDEARVHAKRLNTSTDTPPQIPAVRSGQLPIQRPLLTYSTDSRH
ncbi:MAG TPA: hypothetical protein VLT88_01610 [Desulfosarcina sp.]|nr:hypothetical protein [Desulfosarcina sp.]